MANSTKAPDLGVSRPGPPPPPPVPTIALPQLFASGGQFPTRGGAGPAQYLQGMVQTFAGQAAWGAPRAQGQLLNAMTNQPLVAILGTMYGGDGMRTVGLPNLKGRAAVLGNPGPFGQQTLGMTWLIAVQAAAGGPPLGSLALFGGNYAPPGWLLADGSPQTARDYPDLIALIGYAFGGRGPYFNLPNLTGRTAIGTGQPPGLPAIALGQAVAAPQPALGLGYMICASGAAPPASGNGAFPAGACFAGQIVAYAAAQPPAGWLIADGSLQAPAAYPALAQAIGTTYGGDGKSSFALPDLRSRTVLGA